MMLPPKALVYPMPVGIAAAYGSDGRADACALGFVGMCSHVPETVMIGINSTAKRKTRRSILERGCFTLGFPSRSQIAEADYLGIESGYDADKLSVIGFTAVKGEKVDAPVIEQLKVTLECMVISTSDVGSHTQIFGEILCIHASDDILDEKGRPDMSLADPLMYDDYGFRYYSLGGALEKISRPGRKYKGRRFRTTIGNNTEDYSSREVLPDCPCHHLDGSESIRIRLFAVRLMPADRLSSAVMHLRL